jgi:hypothetical protein
MTPFTLNATRVRARESDNSGCRHHPSSVIGDDPRERGASRPRQRPRDFPGAVWCRCRDPGFAESLGPVSDTLPALGRIHGLPTASEALRISKPLTDVAKGLWHQCSSFGSGSASVPRQSNRRFGKGFRARSCRVGRARGCPAGPRARWTPGGLSLEKRAQGDGGEKTVVAADARTSHAPHLPSMFGSRKQKFPENIPTKPSAMSNSLEINRGRDARSVAREISLEISKCNE